jgi:hypothetical protein
MYNNAVYGQYINHYNYLGCPIPTTLQMAFDISPHADIQHKDSCPLT